MTGTAGATKHYRHALVGELVLDCDTWISPEDPDQRILILAAKPKSPSQERLRILTSWTAGEATDIDARPPAERGQG